MKDKIRTKLQ